MSLTILFNYKNIQNDYVYIIKNQYCLFLKFFKIKTYDGKRSIMSLHHVINPNVIIRAALIVKIHISAHVMASINVNKNELK